MLSDHLRHRAEEPEMLGELPPAIDSCADQEDDKVTRDISFLQAIAVIGSKLEPPADSGPAGEGRRALPARRDPTGMSERHSMRKSEKSSG
jgi:hypothetical protein